MKITVNHWWVVSLTIVALMLSSFSSSAMVVHGVSAITVATHSSSTDMHSMSMTCHDSQAAQAGVSKHSSHGAMSYLSTAHPITDNDCSNKINMDQDCCDTTCVATFVFLPMPIITVSHQYQLILIQDYQRPLILAVNRSLYRPPIA
jgi:hypothetical protein